ncbi:MAG: VOC family protein [Cocleimonas sp.]
MTHIDHITITAPTLELGARLVEKSLGISPQLGGEHPKMGTHNLFLRLGDSMFLEIIACNPDAQKPNRPRWFDLDRIKKDTPAQLRAWVVTTDNIHSSLDKSSEPVGEVEAMSRAHNNWLITIPKDGRLPMNGAAPALIQWQVKEHPAQKLTDFGLSLSKLQVCHPDPERLLRLFSSIELQDDIEVIKANETKLTASINTPKGIRKLNL